MRMLLPLLVMMTLGKNYVAEKICLKYEGGDAFVQAFSPLIEKIKGHNVSSIPLLSNFDLQAMCFVLGSTRYIGATVPITRAPNLGRIFHTPLSRSVFHDRHS